VYLKYSAPNSSLALRQLSTTRASTIKLAIGFSHIWVAACADGFRAMQRMLKIGRGDDCRIDVLGIIKLVIVTGFPTESYLNTSAWF
jgi:hypothetical protein